ncbi:hypothetical protein UT300007_12480 [Clostridium sp. CTA-7]
MKKFSNGISKCFNCIRWKGIGIIAVVLKPTIKYLESKGTQGYPILGVVGNILLAVPSIIFFIVACLCLKWDLFIDIHSHKRKNRNKSEFVDDSKFINKVLPDLIGFMLFMELLDREKIENIIKEKEDKSIYNFGVDTF